MFCPRPFLMRSGVILRSICSVHTLSVLSSSQGRLSPCPTTSFSARLFAFSNPPTVSLIRPARTMEEHLQTIKVDIETKNGQKVELDVTIQDSLPEGSDKGTVIAFHGVPGSHKDYRAVLPHLQEKGVRFIAVDSPGFGYSPEDERLCHDGDEEIQLAREILRRIDPKDKIVFLGHSRGSETALRMTALNENRVNGMVLLNGIGLSPHRAVRPRCFTSFMAWLWTVGSALRFVLSPLFYFFFCKVMCMKVNDGRVAAAVVKSVSLVDFAGQRRYIQQLDDSRVQMLIAYGGSDPIIERSISDHFVHEFGDVKQLSCASRTEDQSVTEEYREAVRSGARRVALCFSKEGHFLQKNHANFIADAIVGMLENRN